MFSEGLSGNAVCEEAFRTANILSEFFDGMSLGFRSLKYVELFGQLRKMLEAPSSTGDREWRSGLMGVHDAMAQKPSKDLTKEQITVIAKEVGNLCNPSWNREMVIGSDHRLRAAGLDTVASDASTLDQR